MNAIKLTKPQQELLESLQRSGNGFFAVMGKQINTARALERNGLVECGAKKKFKARGELKPWTELAVRVMSTS